LEGTAPERQQQTPGLQTSGFQKISVIIRPVGLHDYFSSNPGAAAGFRAALLNSHLLVRGHPKFKVLMSVDLNKSVSAGPLCFAKTL
jgi:hypothetical protein